MPRHHTPVNQGVSTISIQDREGKGELSQVRLMGELSSGQNCPTERCGRVWIRFLFALNRLVIPRAFDASWAVSECMIGSFPPEGGQWPQPGKDFSRSGWFPSQFNSRRLPGLNGSVSISSIPCATRASSSPPTAPPVKNSLTAPKLKRDTNTRKISI